MDLKLKLAATHQAPHRPFHGRATCRVIPSFCNLMRFHDTGVQNGTQQFLVVQDDAQQFFALAASKDAGNYAVHDRRDGRLSVSSEKTG